MQDKKMRQKLLLLLVIISVVATGFHYTDNFLYFDQYPDPNWITPDSVYISWLILTLIGVVGYFLYARDIFWIAYLCLSIYSLTGISSLGHYFIPSTQVFSLKMHTFIWLDALVGTLVLSFTLWSSLLLREWRQVIAS